MPDVRIVIALRQQPRHIMPQGIDAVTLATWLQGQSSGKFFAAFAAEAGLVDFEGLIFGLLADCVMADQRIIAPSSAGFEIA